MAELPDMKLNVDSVLENVISRQLRKSVYFEVVITALNECSSDGKLWLFDDNGIWGVKERGKEPQYFNFVGDAVKHFVKTLVEYSKGAEHDQTNV